ncbi:MAG: AAA family ATPase [Propionibacteriaceae bacterium]|jgi:energy-coupling factor transporter ATP-binding protein EcfA2|nr:AAA family ATPase [Propionibacteriaceae bacterium]
MLISFSTRNYRSFRDQATLDLRSPGGAAAGAKPWDGNVQAVAGLYGANASGKTTFFNAILSMAQQVAQSYRRSAVVGEPFAFDSTSRDQPTEFSATFIAADGVCYAYGFGVLNGKVDAEWAERYTTARPTTLFQRDGQSFKYGAALKGANKAVERTVQPSALYLSAAAAAGHEGLAPLSNWFSQRLRAFPAGGHGSLLGHVLDSLAKDAARRGRLEGMLVRADLGLAGLDLTKRDLSEVERSQLLRADAALRALTGQDVSIDLSAADWEAHGVHRFAGQDWQLPLDLESDGTRAMLCHAFVVDEALRAGATIVFDEVDTSLHPLLVRELVLTFREQRFNPLQAQLVFTTHDVSLMEAGYGNGSQLGRDEVWLVQKDAASGRSTLAALADYSPRARDNLARRYLSGRYGGVPEPMDLVDPVLV